MFLLPRSTTNIRCNNTYKEYFSIAAVRIPHLCAYLLYVCRHMLSSSCARNRIVVLYCRSGDKQKIASCCNSQHPVKRHNLTAKDHIGHTLMCCARGQSQRQTGHWLHLWLMCDAISCLGGLDPFVLIINNWTYSILTRSSDNAVQHVYIHTYICFNFVVYCFFLTPTDCVGR